MEGIRAGVCNYEYPQTAQALCACQQARVAINIFMLKTATMVVLAKRLISNELQNGAFCLAKCAVLQANTGPIAVRDRSFQNAKRHIRKVKAAEAVF